MNRYFINETGIYQDKVTFFIHKYIPWMQIRMDKEMAVGHIKVNVKQSLRHQVAIKGRVFKDFRKLLAFGKLHGNDAFAAKLLVYPWHPAIGNVFKVFCETQVVLYFIMEIELGNQGLGKLVGEVVYPDIAYPRDFMQEVCEEHNYLQVVLHFTFNLGPLYFYDYVLAV